MSDDDITWTNLSGDGYTFTHLALYAELTKRDWRWLWLRKRTYTRLLWDGPMDDEDAE